MPVFQLEQTDPINIVLTAEHPASEKYETGPTMEIEPMMQTFEIQPKEIVEKSRFPDGGFQAWLQVLVSFCAQFVVIGSLNIYGVYQTHYNLLADSSQDQTFSNSSTVSISFIGATAASVFVLLGLPVGTLADRIGYNRVFCAGAVMYALSLSLASLSKQYWHLLCTQGILFGCALSLVYFPALAIISHYFEKRKGLATGIAVSGAGIGGMVLGPTTRLLIFQYEWRKSLLYTGLFGGAVLLFISLAIRTKLTANSNSWKDATRMLKNPTTIILLISGFFISFGYFIPFYFVSLYAVRNGLSESEGALLVAILNGSSAAGRIALGVIADHLGYVSTLACCLYVSSFSIFFIWPFTTSMIGLSIFVIIYGFFVGGYISLTSPTCVHLFGRESVAGVTGLVYGSAFLGNLLGSPAAAILITAFTTKSAVTNVITTDFRPAIVMAGSGLFMGATFTVLLNWKSMKEWAMVHIGKHPRESSSLNHIVVP